MKPLIEVSGLRSSCDAVATKSLLACSRRARSVMSRSVHTTPPSGPARRAAVTASARSPVAPDLHLAHERVGDLRQRAVRAVGERADAQRRDELARARVQRRDAVLVVADDEAVAEALDRRRQALALGLDALARGGQVRAHRVEGDADGLELLRPAGLHARAEVARRQPPRGADEVVQRPAHRADEQREEGEHADERQPGAEDDRQQRRCASGSRRRRGRSRGAAAGAWRAPARRCARCAGCARPRARVRVDGGVHGERARGPARGRDRRDERPAGAVLAGQRARRARRRRRSCARRWRRSGRRGASAAGRGSPPAPRSRRAGWPRRPRARRRRRRGSRRSGGRRRARRSRSRR